jgi:hypothetical protein
MTFVSEIPIADIKVVALTGAPVGSFLQIIDSINEPEIILRCEFPTMNGRTLGGIYLEGAKVGQFFSDSDLPYYIALDVNHLASVVLTDAAPRSLGGQPLQAGMVCQATDLQDEPFIAMAVALSNDPARFVGYVHLHDPRRGHIENTKAQPIHLGKAAVIEFRKTVIER